ncbi:hypothetical protein OJ253_2526 [Cryptosporidium canis]|uniref:Uncharacterized protein n=1 Tax=Cryptosporidium canis TaxID=195482 RepID=A0A9D5DFC5_9CRYT|nr:hypothetical protein OJ253_2526 [Cryptosporidium canis]
MEIVAAAESSLLTSSLLKNLRLSNRMTSPRRVDLRQEPLHVGVLKVRDSVGFESEDLSLRGIEGVQQLVGLVEVDVRKTHKLVVYKLGDFEEGREQPNSGSGGGRDSHPAEQLAQSGGALRGQWPPGHSGDGAQSVREGALGASPGEALQDRGEPGVDFGVSSVGGLEVFGESSHVEEALAELIGDNSVEALEVPKHGREDAGIELGHPSPASGRTRRRGPRRSAGGSPESPPEPPALEQVDQEVDLGSEGLLELRVWGTEGGDEHAGLLRDWPEVRNGGEEPRSLVEEEARETAAEDFGVVDLDLRELEPGSPQGDSHVRGELVEDQEVVEEVVDAVLDNMDLPEELSGREGVGDADEHPGDEGLVVEGLGEVHVDYGVRLALLFRLREVVDVVGVEHVRRDGSQDLSCRLDGGGVCQEGSRQLVVEAVVLPEGERDRRGVTERGLLGRRLVQEPVDESGGLLEMVRVHAPGGEELSEEVEDGPGVESQRGSGDEVGTILCPDPDGTLRSVGLTLREVVDNNTDVREDEGEGGPRGGGEVLGELQSDKVNDS